MCWASRFGLGMGVVSINAFQVCLKSLPILHDENLAAYCLIFMAKIQQSFTLDASQHAKRYSYQVFHVRIQQWGCPIFTVKIQQSFTFDVLWRIGRISCSCIWRVFTCSYRNEPKPFKASSMLMSTAYTGNQCHLVTWIKAIIPR